VMCGIVHAMSIQKPSAKDSPEVDNETQGTQKGPVNSVPYLHARLTDSHSSHTHPYDRNQSCINHS